MEKGKDTEKRVFIFNPIEWFQQGGYSLTRKLKSEGFDMKKPIRIGEAESGATIFYQDKEV